MSHVISLIGLPAVGKSTFAQWFVERNPIYKYVDIADARRKTGALEEGISNALLLRREDAAWQHVQQALSSASFVVLESNGLSHRLFDVYRDYSCTSVVKLTASKSDIVTRILKREYKSSELELEYLNEDMSALHQTKCHLECNNLQLHLYPKLEAMIFMLLMESQYANPSRK